MGISATGIRILFRNSHFQLRTSSSVLYDLSMRTWSVFCIGMTALLTVGLMIPRYFGLQNFTQWAGMYVDGWCGVDMYSANPFANPLPPDLQHETVLAGGVHTTNVFDPPQFNEQTCVVWAKTRCNRPSPEGKWHVAYVVPSLKKKQFLGKTNICDLPIEADSWFDFTP